MARQAELNEYVRCQPPTVLFFLPSLTSRNFTWHGKMTEILIRHMHNGNATSVNVRGESCTYPICLLSSLFMQIIIYLAYDHYVCSIYILCSILHNEINDISIV